MTDYTPTTTEDIYSCFDYGYRNRSKVSFSATKKAFDSWLAQHDAAIRADEREHFAAAYIAHYSKSCDHWATEECLKDVAAARGEDME